MTKPKTAPRARYTLEFKQEAVRLVEGGQSIAAAARTLGVVDQALFNSGQGKSTRPAHGRGQQAVAWMKRSGIRGVRARPTTCLPGWKKLMTDRARR